MIRARRKALGFCPAFFAGMVGLLGAVGAGSSASESKEGWPIVDEGLLFATGGSLEEIYAFDPTAPEELLFNSRLRSSGFARMSSVGDLLLNQGTFSTAGQGEFLLERLESSPGFAIEVLALLSNLEPKKPEEGRARVESGRDPTIVSFGAGLSLVFSEGRTLKLEGTLKPTGMGSAEPFRVLASIGDASLHRSRHVVIQGRRKSGKGGTGSRDREPTFLVELRVYCGNELQGQGSGEVVGRNLFALGVGGGTRELQFGCGRKGKPGFDGTIKGFGLYGRALSDDRIESSVRRASRMEKQRTHPERMRLEARVVQRSHLALPEEIAPYRESLSVFEYEVLKVTEGFYFPKKVRVAHWAVLDEESLPFGRQLKNTDQVVLVLEKFSENPQLKTVHLSDTLEIDFDLELYYDAGGRSLTSAQD